MTYRYLTVDMIVTAKKRVDLSTRKRSRLLESKDLILWFWPMQTCKCSTATSRTLDLCLNPSAISFSSTEMEANIVNWVRSWANWCLMQLKSISIPHAIAKLLKRRASMSSLAKNRGFCPKTKVMALLLLKFTIKSNDPEKLFCRVTSAYRNFKAPRGQKWTRTSIQDSEIQPPTPGLLLKQCKMSTPPPKRMPCLEESYALSMNIRPVLKFTKEEDDFLKEGITKHRFGKWTAILKDLPFKFQDERTADVSTLKERAGMKMPLA